MEADSLELDMSHLPQSSHDEEDLRGTSGGGGGGGLPGRVLVDSAQGRRVKKKTSSVGRKGTSHCRRSPLS